MCWVVPCERHLEEYFSFGVGLSVQKILREASHTYAAALYRTFAFDRHLPPRPCEYSRQPGWTRYRPDGSMESVPCPQEPVYIFDIETCVTEGPYPTLAVAVSDQAWYSWVSQRLASFGTVNEGRYSGAQELIPLQGPGQQKEVLVIGHAVAYDRQRVLDEYSLVDSKLRFLDTMSIHMATSGMASHQKSKWKQSKRLHESLVDAAEEDIIEDVSAVTTPIEEEWIRHCSPPSLRDCYKHWCNKGILTRKFALSCLTFSAFLWFFCPSASRCLPSAPVFRSRSVEGGTGHLCGR